MQKSAYRPSTKPVYLGFFIYAFALGTLFPRIGDIQTQLKVEEGALGLAITGLPIGVQISLLIADRILESMRIRTVMLFGVPIIGLSFWFAALMPTAFLFFICLFFCGLAVGVIEVAVNLEADRTEYQLGSRIMNRSHAFWSLGFFATSIAGAFMAQAGISPAQHFLLFAIIGALATAYVFWSFEQAPERPGADVNTPLFVKPTKPIMLLVFLTLSAMLVEGSSIDWSVIYMRDTFATVPLVSGLALAFVAFSQFVTRFFADSVVERYGPEFVSKISIILMFVGVSIVAFSQLAALSLFGFMLMGIGCAVIFPLAMSAAAQLQDRPAAVNIASLAQISFVVFLLAPPLLGFVAEHIHIRAAFGLSLPLIIISWFSVHGLRPTKVD